MTGFARAVGVLIAGVVVALLVLSGVQAAFSDAAQDTGDQFVVQNETWTVQTGSAVSLDESNRADVVYANSTEISVRQNGEPVPEENNWRWDEQNGTITALSGGELTDGTPADITYRYYDPTSEQELARDVGTALPQLGDGLVWLLFLGVIGAAFLTLTRQ
jgi:hypothetical protein